jgi:hypothetical protein
MRILAAVVVVQVANLVVFARFNLAALIRTLVLRQHVLYIGLPSAGVVPIQGQGLKGEAGIVYDSEARAGWSNFPNTSFHRTPLTRHSAISGCMIDQENPSHSSEPLI